jgi:carbonic anhydrase
MTYLARRQIPFLIMSLVLALPAAAEEQKAPATPATAAKPAAPAAAVKLDPSSPAPVKPAVAAAPATIKLDPSSPPPVKPAAATAAPAKSEAAAPASTKLALAAPSAAATPKPDAGTAAVESKPAEVPAPQRARAKPHKTPALQRVALTTTAAPAAAPVAPAAPHSLHWSYEGETGPRAWAKLTPEFAKCGNGERQSPIDIRDGMKLDLEPITFEYRPSSFKVIDNGHTIQANVNGWNQMRVMGRRFRLVQFHFHTPSEETIDGRQYDMVVHLVHKDGEGRLGVVAVLVEGGSRQPAIQAVLNNLPLEKGEEVSVAANLDLNQILPADRKYFTYMGSLTTPPCTEDVLWIVMKQPVQASPDQLNLFTRLYPMNARPTQATSGRTIKESN